MVGGSWPVVCCWSVVGGVVPRLTVLLFIYFDTELFLDPGYSNTARLCGIY